MDVLRALIEAYPAAVHLDIKYLQTKQRVKVRACVRVCVCVGVHHHVVCMHTGRSPCRPTVQSIKINHPPSPASHRPVMDQFIDSIDRVWSLSLCVTRWFV